LISEKTKKNLRLHIDRGLLDCHFVEIRIAQVKVLTGPRVILSPANCRITHPESMTVVISEAGSNRWLLFLKTMSPASWTLSMISPIARVTARRRLRRD